MSDRISIRAGMDLAAIGRQYAGTGRVRIAEFLQPTAAEDLSDAIRSHEHWYLTYAEGSQAVECPQSSLHALAPQQRKALFGAIHRQAADGFQYCFLQYYISEAIGRGENPGNRLHEAHELVNGEAFLELMRRVTGVEAIRSADVLASCYAPGHFLTMHDDRHQSHNRVAAYVLGLTRDWNPSWGGHLAFFDERGDIETAFKPDFNVLSVFSVPQLHAVQMVAPFARGLRTSLTGWVHT